jgi:hypothetical protein
LLAEGYAEAVVRTEYHEVPSQIRMDWLNLTRGIIDLKTCDNLTWFEADARRYGYAHQLAFYRGVYAVASKSLVPCYLIGIEKQPPYRCGVWQLAEPMLEVATRENVAAIARLRACDATNQWPTGYEEPRIFDSY